jgi:hypothetical protein
MNTNINSIHHTDKFAQNSRPRWHTSRLLRRRTRPGAIDIFNWVFCVSIFSAAAREEPNRVFAPLSEAKKPKLQKVSKTHNRHAYHISHFSALKHSNKFLKLSFSHGKNCKKCCFLFVLKTQLHWRSKCEHWNKSTALLYCYSFARSFRSSSTFCVKWKSTGWCSFQVRVPKIIPR